MSALDSLYGAGIASQGLGQGLQGLVEGYKMKRELDNQQNYFNMMGQWRQAQGGMNDARALLLEEQMRRLQAGQTINGSQPGGRGGSSQQFDPVSTLKDLMPIYGSDPDQLKQAMQDAKAGNVLKPFVPKTMPTPPAAAPQQGSAWFHPSQWPAAIASAFSPAPAQAANLPASPKGLQPASAAPGAPAPGPSAAPRAGGSYNWKSVSVNQPQ